MKPPNTIAMHKLCDMWLGVKANKRNESRVTVWVFALIMSRHWRNIWWSWMIWHMTCVLCWVVAPFGYVLELKYVNVNQFSFQNMSICCVAIKCKSRNTCLIMMQDNTTCCLLIINYFSYYHWNEQSSQLTKLHNTQPPSLLRHALNHCSAPVWKSLGHLSGMLLG